MDDKTNYNLVVFRKKIIFFFLIATVIISFITDISTGPAQLSLMDVIRSLLNPDSIDKKQISLSDNKASDCHNGSPVGACLP